MRVSPARPKSAGLGRVLYNRPTAQMARPTGDVRPWGPFTHLSCACGNSLIQAKGEDRQPALHLESSCVIYEHDGSSAYVHLPQNDSDLLEGWQRPLTSVSPPSHTEVTTFTGCPTLRQTLGTLVHPHNPISLLLVLAPFFNKGHRFRKTTFTRAHSSQMLEQGQLTPQPTLSTTRPVVLKLLIVSGSLYTRKN